MTITMDTDRSAISPESPQGPRRQQHLVVLGLLVAAMAVAFAAVWVTRARGEAGLDATAAMQAPTNASKAVHVGGCLGPCPAGDWVRYNGWAAAPDIAVPQTAWVRDPNGAPVRMAVYDSPDGKLIGYAYLPLGYIPESMANSFDWHAASVAQWGCDVFGPNCAATGAPRLAPGQAFPSPDR